MLLVNLARGVLSRVVSAADWLWCLRICLDWRNICLKVMLMIMVLVNDTVLILERYVVLLSCRMDMLNIEAFGYKNDSDEKSLQHQA